MAERDDERQQRVQTNRLGMGMDRRREDMVIRTMKYVVYHDPCDDGFGAAWQRLKNLDLGLSYSWV